MVAGILSAVEAARDEGGDGGTGGRSRGATRVNEIGKAWTERAEVNRGSQIEADDIRKGRVELGKGTVEGGWGVKNWRRAAVCKDEAVITHLLGGGGDGIKGSIIDFAEDCAVLLDGVGGEVGPLDERAPCDGASRCFVGLVGGGQFENLVGAEDNADGP